MSRKRAMCCAHLNPLGVPIHGLGLFALDPVPAGTPIWSFDPVIDQDIAESDLASYPDHVREYLEHYCEYFPELGTLVLSGDSDRYTNHSDTPNTHKERPNHPRARVIAARDIKAGEEITANYDEVRSMKWLKLTAGTKARRHNPVKQPEMAK